MKDPVCGMEVDEQQARDSSQHQGRKYAFCSGECKQEFERNPDRYTRAAS